MVVVALVVVSCEVCLVKYMMSCWQIGSFYDTTAHKDSDIASAKCWMFYIEDWLGLFQRLI